MLSCTNCGIFACMSGELEKAPHFCIMKTHEALLEEIKKIYDMPKIRKLLTTAAKIESKGYMKWIRLEEIIEFAKLMDYKRLGLAFCIGLMKEAAEMTKILENRDFEVVSVMCKLFSIPKEDIGLKDEEKVRPGIYEPVCNPVGQALVLNKENTDLNVIMGLCVGHDTLFIRYSNAPVTYFATKDRVLGHNPMVALYSRYYKRKLLPQK